jgi:hypothetical protein
MKRQRDPTDPDATEDDRDNYAKLAYTGVRISRPALNAVFALNPSLRIVDRGFVYNNPDSLLGVSCYTRENPAVVYSHWRQVPVHLPASRGHGIQPPRLAEDVYVIFADRRKVKTPPAVVWHQWSKSLARKDGAYHTSLCNVIAGDINHIPADAIDVAHLPPGGHQLCITCLYPHLWALLRHAVGMRFPAESLRHILSWIL